MQSSYLDVKPLESATHAVGMQKRKIVMGMAATGKEYLQAQGKIFREPINRTDSSLMPAIMLTEESVK
jgi:hypothetical protein